MNSSCAEDSVRDSFYFTLVRFPAGFYCHAKNTALPPA